ncbi:MAG: hypothetical protein ACMZ7B_09505 [Balneola sp.]
MLFFFLLNLSLSCKYIEYVGEWSNEAQGFSQSIAPPLGLPQLIELEPLQKTYFADDKISGVFINSFSEAYSFSPNGGPPTRLQKWNGQTWTKVDTSPRAIYIQSVTYRPIEWGATVAFSFPTERMESLGIEITGLYRFTYMICESKNYDDCQIIYSPEFYVKFREAESIAQY